MKPAALPTRSLGSVALACLVSFPVIVVALNLIQRARYNAVSQAISELALGRDGWLMAVAFCSVGAGFLCVAILLKRTVTKAVAAPVLLTAAAVLAGPVSAAFHTDPAGGGTTVHGQIHDTAGIVTFIILIAAMFVASRGFFRDPAWRRLAVPSLAWSLCATGAFFLVPLLGNSEFGLAQRIFVITWLIWLITVAAHARRLPAAAEQGSLAGLAPQAGHG